LENQFSFFYLANNDRVSTRCPHSENSLQSSDVFFRARSSLFEWWQTDVKYLYCQSAYYSSKGGILVSSNIRKKTTSPFVCHLYCQLQYSHGFLWILSQVRMVTNQLDELTLIFAFSSLYQVSLSQVSKNREQHLNFSSRDLVAIFIQKKKWKHPFRLKQKLFQASDMCLKFLKGMIVLIYCSNSRGLQNVFHRWRSGLICYHVIPN
jgi:hypothetical protein